MQVIGRKFVLFKQKKKEESLHRRAGKMKTLLYGGTFDPPHNGHMNNLRATGTGTAGPRPRYARGHAPHKHASATPAELRLQMCACFTALPPAVQVSNWEIRRGGRSYTVHTLEWLRSQDPDGALVPLRRQRHAADVSEMVPLAGYAENGCPRRRAVPAPMRPPLHAAAAELKKAGGRVLFARAESYPCASSDIRSGKDPAGAVAGGAAAGGAGSDKGASAVRGACRGGLPPAAAAGEGTPPYA